MERDLGDRRTNLIDRLERLERYGSDNFKSIEEKGHERMTEVMAEAITKKKTCQYPVKMN